MIKSTDLTCNVANVIDSFTIEWGSDLFVDMIQPAILRMSCLGWTGGTPMQAIGQSVSIQWQGWNLYTGIIRGISVEDQGNGTYIYNVDAESPWASISLKNVGGNGYPAALDDARIDAILTDAGAYSWADIDPTVVWSAMTTAWYGYTWADWATYVDKIIGFTTGTNLFNFAAYTSGEQNALGLLDQQSADCRGRFYTPWSSGYLYWKSYADVTSQLAAPTFTIAGATEIIDGTLTASGTVADIYNVVNLTDELGVVTGVADSNSISIFGIRELDISTNLIPADATTTATQILQTAAGVRSNLTGFRINASDWSTARGQSFLLDCISANIGAAAVTGIPAAFGGNQNILVTGGTLIYESNTTVFDIKCQTANEVSAVQMWQQVDVSYTWATYLPNSIWSEAA